MSKLKIIKKANVIKRQCVGCGSCVLVCPKGAIHVQNGVYAIVDMEMCVGCGLCKKECPASVIEMQIVEENKDDSRKEMV